MKDTDPAIAKILAAYKSSAEAKDVDAFMRLYDPGVRVFDTWGVWSYEGAPAWRSAVEGWFTSLGAQRMKITFDDVVSVVTPALASVSAIVSYGAETAQGEPVRAMQNRITWVLKTSGHLLRIIHEHTSAPAGFEDSKLILERPRSA